MILAELRSASRASLCVECGKCSTLCPLAAFADYSAARVAAIRDPESDLQQRAGAVQRCLTCSLCEIRCPQGVRYSDFVLGLRAEISESMRHPCPHGEVLQAAARLMAGSAELERDLSWLDDDLRVATEGELALFIGCLPIFDAVFADELGTRTLDIAKAAIRILNRIGIEPVVVHDERCCGHDLLWIGERGEFEALARANARAFESRGVRRILTTCAECCRTWRLDYPGIGGNYRPRVQHLSEFLAEKIETGEVELLPGGEEVVTYHDPCRLGRHLGVFDAPRELIRDAHGADFVEMEHAGPDAVCCGSPGFIRCDGASRALQRERLGGAAAAGATRMLTACPKCLIHFSCALHEDRQRERETPPVEVQDLTVFTAARLVPRAEREAI